MTDTLPTLSSEEVEQIEKEAMNEFPENRVVYGIDFNGPERKSFIAGATLVRRRAKAEREELMKAAQEVVDLDKKYILIAGNTKLDFVTHMGSIGPITKAIAALESVISKLVGETNKQEEV